MKSLFLALAAMMLLASPAFACGGSGAHACSPTPPGQTQHQAAAVSAAQARIVGLDQHAAFYAANPSPLHAQRLVGTEAKIAKQEAIIAANQ